MGEYTPKYDLDIVKMSDAIESAPYLFTDDFELYGAMGNCGPCGGKCYGCGGSGPKQEEKSESGLAKKVIELLEK